MKKAIAYTRISTKDQSNFSITGQADIIRSYCSKNEIEIITLFTDEGESAKNFDRPDWKLLEDFVKKNHAEVDMLIVAKFDRFSRNVAEAIQMIEQLEQRFHIRVISAMEPIHLHPDSPFYFQFRSQILLSGNVELLIIRDRTRFGMHHALKSGRYVSKAPIGYRNSKDQFGKPLLIKDPVKTALVVTIYDRYLQGDTVYSILKRIQTMGFALKGHSAIQSILRNPIYMGFVKVPSYYDEPEQMIKGLHEPIIDADTWWQVHALLHKKKKPFQYSLSAEFPLRGVLKCFCGRHFTGANSKGKTKYVGYYKCNHHTGSNYNAARLHKQFDEILKTLSLPKFHIEYLQQKIYENINIEMDQRQQQVQQQQQKFSALEKKIDDLEESFISKQITHETFKKWMMRYQTEKSLLRSQLADITTPVEQTWQNYEKNMARLADLHFIFHQLDVQDKQAFIRQVFDSRLYYQGATYRTPYIMPVFQSKALELKEKGLLLYEQPEQESGQFALCAPNRNTIEPLQILFSLFNNIKTA